MAEQLWASSDTALWKEHLDAAYERVGRLGRPGLLELERLAMCHNIQSPLPPQLATSLQNIGRLWSVQVVC